MNDFARISLIQHMSKIGKVVFAGNFISKVIVWLLEYKATKKIPFLKRIQTPVQAYVPFEM